ncbi:nuclear transport factor 2 family protein [Actinomadura sp. 9N407]|uniref:nuclear transport factor 2 family protein n=1 Tax=Actinomadura sp. 9N407 TaxID=3375154 RepID=UPI0037BB0E33
MTPEDLFHQGLRLLLDKDIDGWVALCDENVVIEFPFAPDGYPSRLEGRAAVADYMSDYPDHIDLQDFPYLEIHRTGDPETVITEMRATARVVSTGTPIEIPYIVVMTARNDRIVRYRDYWNPLAMPASMSDAKS